MTSGASEAREERTVAGKVRIAVTSPARPVRWAIAACLVGLALEIWAFLTGIEVDPSRPARRRTIATLGLVGALLVGGGFLRLVREGELPLEAVLVLAGVGFAFGSFAAYDLTRDPHLFLEPTARYAGIVLVGGSWVSVVLVVLAGVLWKLGTDLWKTAIAAPVLLQAGAHLAVLLELWRHAGQVT